PFFKLRLIVPTQVWCAVLLQRDGRVHTVVDRGVAEPARRHRLRLRIKLDDLLAIRTQVTQFRASGTGKAEVGNGHRNGDIDADLAYIDFALELASGGAALSEKSHAVTHRIAVDQFDCVLECRYGQNDEHRPKDLFAVNPHVGGDIRED